MLTDLVYQGIVILFLNLFVWLWASRILEPVVFFLSTLLVSLGAIGEPLTDQVSQKYRPKHFQKSVKEGGYG